VKIVSAQFVFGVSEQLTIYHLAGKYIFKAFTPKVSALPLQEWEQNIMDVKNTPETGFNTYTHIQVKNYNNDKSTQKYIALHQYLRVHTTFSAC